VHNEIPFGRGLGSSGAAVIAGVLLADAVGGLQLSEGRKLDYALMVERHPDNVAAALLGGFVASYLRELPPADLEAASIPLSEVLPEFPPDADENWGKDPPRAPEGIGHYVKLGWAKEVKCVIVVPEFEVSTSLARGVLKDEYSRKDIVRFDSASADASAFAGAEFAVLYTRSRYSIFSDLQSLPRLWEDHLRTQT